MQDNAMIQTLYMSGSQALFLIWELCARPYKSALNNISNTITNLALVAFSVASYFESGNKFENKTSMYLDICNYSLITAFAVSF